MRTSLVFALSLLVALLSPGCATRTEVLLVVDSDIPGLNQITVSSTSPSGTMQSSSAVIGTGDLPLPRTLGMTWSSGPLGPYTVLVTGYHNGVALVSRTASFSFVQNQTRILHLDLLLRCQIVTCPSGQSCGESGCAPIAVPESALDPYTGTIPGRGADGGPQDGGVDAPLYDAGLDAAVCNVETCNQRDDDCDRLIDEDFVLATDPANCGMCGNVCALDHVTENGCATARCTVVTCETGWDDCDGRNSTGCETPVTGDRFNCGQCGMRCNGATPMCCNGSCAASCP